MSKRKHAITHSALHTYLRRIEYGGPLAVSRQTLHNLHRAHLLAIPFENIDVQTGHVPSLNPDAIFEKIVERHRGGWCFEMNALFGWALREIGFDVEFISAAAGRDKRGEPTHGNHLALIVRLEHSFLADVGFGNGTLIPIPLREGPHNDTRFDFRLSRDGDWWRFHNHRHDGSTYDFKEIPVALETFAAQNRSLASDADSSFVRNLVCMRMTEDGMVALTNTVFQHYSATELKEETAPNAARFAEILHEFFDLSVDPIEPLWERASAQRKDWLRKKLRGF